jgi:hypothetical protein
MTDRIDEIRERWEGLGPWRLAGEATIRTGKGWVGSVHWRDRHRHAPAIARAPEDIAYLLERIDYLQTELWDAQEQAEFLDGHKSQGC